MQQKRGRLRRWARGAGLLLAAFFVIAWVHDRFAERPTRTEADVRARAEYRRALRAKERGTTGTPEPASALVVNGAVGPVPAALRVNGFYRKHIDAGGIPVLASDKVPDAALVVARDIVQAMLASRPDLARALVEHGLRTGVMAEVETTMDIPEYRMKRPGVFPLLPMIQADRDFWAERARGLGGNPTTGAEENLLGYPRTPYFGENIFVHEFAHAIAHTGIYRVDRPLFDEIGAAYSEAMSAGKYVHPDGRRHYATTNKDEYWAEGVQWWFFSNYGETFTGGIRVDTPEQLAAYDPKLHALLGRVFTTHRIPADVFHGKRIRP